MKRLGSMMVGVVFSVMLHPAVLDAQPATSAQKEELLDQHNLVRCNVSPAAASMPVLNWDFALEKVAQDYANTCQFLTHNPNRTAQYDALTGSTDYVGENIFASTDPVDMTAGVQLWSDEVINYTLATNTCAAGQVCGHYTQLVWANTLRVGCGYAFCPTQAFPYSVICDYAPGGNIIGQFPYVAGGGPNAACAGSTVPGARGDINGDGKADILWRNGSSGSNAYWLMSGTGIITSGPLPLVADTNFKVVGLGDFQGDGKVDILWRNQSTGTNVIWLMNGPTVAASFVLPGVPSNWIVAGVGDFQGDGKADILWRNTSTGDDSLWLMNGGGIAVGAALPSVPDTTWQVAGIGDVQGDGKADIVWRNSVSGANSVWLMNGASVAVGAGLPMVPDSNWKMVGLDDLQGDGKDDIVWRNSLTGNNSVWFMNGTTVAVSATLTPVLDTTWQIVRLADFQGDGKADLLWRNSVTGANVQWLMNGPSIAVTTVLPSVADTNWKVAGPP